ncbi:hypothetical protein SAMN05660742_11031 [Propionispira arboris]|uniref:Uncharacterized protein n=1 Tax=Propionispira arboris TaxID=84035 RepID=A0A1H6ZNG1_9FIRM|nr:hypothetical protein [Propionispira arboris]SEJ54788.1 hypothetical protein SAMN05660742_11031 [Propionispira arboris]
MKNRLLIAILSGITLVLFCGIFVVDPSIRIIIVGVFGTLAACLIYIGLDFINTRLLKDEAKRAETLSEKFSGLSDIALTWRKDFNDYLVTRNDTHRNNGIVISQISGEINLLIDSISRQTETLLQIKEDDNIVKSLDEIEAQIQTLNRMNAETQKMHNKTLLEKFEGLGTQNKEIIQSMYNIEKNTCEINKISEKQFLHMQENIELLFRSVEKVVSQDEKVQEKLSTEITSMQMTLLEVQKQFAENAKMQLQEQTQLMQNYLNKMEKTIKGIMESFEDNSQQCLNGIEDNVSHDVKALCNDILDVVETMEVQQEGLNKIIQEQPKLIESFKNELTNMHEEYCSMNENDITLMEKMLNAK